MPPSERSLKNLRPPWPAGKSANPGGRPRKKPITERYEELADTPLPDELRRKLKMEEGSTYGDAVAYRVFLTAITGKHEAAKEIREAIEGRAPQAVHLSGPGGKGISINTPGQRPLKGIAQERLLKIIALADAAAKEAAGGPLPPAP